MKPFIKSLLLIIIALGLGVFVISKSDDMTKNWLISSETDATYKYPESLGTKYISLVDWPPKISVTNEPLNCENAGVVIAGAEKVERVVIGRRLYCVTSKMEGAAGSTYTEYTYGWSVRGNKMVSLSFTTKAVQCMNYDEPKQSECLTEREIFDIGKTINLIASTLILK